MGKKIDMIDKTFGKLTVIKRASIPQKGKAISYVCKCECGKEIVVNGKSLRNGSRTSCGCDKQDHMIGQRFGKLIVIKQSPIKTNQNKIQFECLCDCGNTKVVPSMNLKIGKTKSCGCINESKKVNMNDLIGQKFDRLNVIAINDKTKHLYTCKCDCGATAIVNRYNLLNGYSTNCGCVRKEKLSDNKIDIIGQKFGMLTVLEEAGYDNYGKIKYKCLCECGNITVTPGNNIRNSYTLSCGCLSSRCNSLIAQLLTKWQIDYIPEKTFDDCRNVNPLPFDFYIPSLNMCIEYDGEFHYIESYLHNLQGQQKRDRIKTEYCKNKDIELLRIPYWEKENIEEILRTQVKNRAERLNEKATLKKYINTYLCNISY